MESDNSNTSKDGSQTDNSQDSPKKKPYLTAEEIKKMTPKEFAERVHASMIYNLNNHFDKEDK